jgi:drug/metabolite transporter (DMT)-like permease
VLTVVALSLLAAFLWASSAVLQQRAALRAGRKGALALDRVVPGHSLLLALAREPLWLAGWLSNLGGFLAQAGALYLGSVSIVQPLIVAQLLFALPLSRVGTGQRMPPAAWWAAGAVSAGLAILLVVRGEPPSQVHVRDAHLIAAIAVTVAVAVSITIWSRGQSPALRAPLFGIAGGFFYALNAVLIKRSTEQLLDHGARALATSWYLYVLIGATIVSMTLSQTAYACGPFAGAVTGMNIANPVVSYLLGVLVYGVPAPTAADQIAGLTAAAGLVIVGVVALARLLPPPLPEGPPVVVPAQEPATAPKRVLAKEAVAVGEAMSAKDAGPAGEPARRRRAASAGRRVGR